jgi:hypothetical protein
MRKRDEWIERVKGVELEYRVAVLAATVLRERIRAESHLLAGGLKQSDFNRMSDRLEATYLIRLYAVFEAGLRDAWRVALGRDTDPRMRDLLDSLASKRKLPSAVLNVVHRVREFRNSLVHDQYQEPEESFTIGQARGHLTKFFSHLPPDW